MPAVTLCVCVCGERDLLARLLRECAGCYDDLVVIHDGPEGDRSGAPPQQPPALDYAGLPSGEKLANNFQPASGGGAPAESVAALVAEYGGRLFFGPRSYQQEPHWPFAWAQVQHPWIYKLDADEFPGPEMKAWLQAFRTRPDPGPNVSGYTCAWPLWDGIKSVTRHWPAGRNFLFHRDRVSFFGMVEHIPVADVAFTALPLALEHRPKRKSFGFANLILRRQAYRWRRVIAQSLLGTPADLPRWRHAGNDWPPIWEAIRQRPLRTALQRLLLWPLYTLRDQWQKEGRIILSAAATGGLHHFLICLVYWRLRRTA